MITGYYLLTQLLITFFNYTAVLICFCFLYLFFLFANFPIKFVFKNQII